MLLKNSVHWIVTNVWINFYIWHQSPLVTSRGSIWDDGSFVRSLNTLKNWHTSFPVCIAKAEGFFILSSSIKHWIVMMLKDSSISIFLTSTPYFRTFSCNWWLMSSWISLLVLPSRDSSLKEGIRDSGLFGASLSFLKFVREELYVELGDLSERSAPLEQSSGLLIELGLFYKLSLA